jgi:hypothetical protein
LLPLSNRSCSDQNLHHPLLVTLLIVLLNFDVKSANTFLFEKLHHLQIPSLKASPFTLKSVGIRTVDYFIQQSYFLHLSQSSPLSTLSPSYFSSLNFIDEYLIWTSHPHLNDELNPCCSTHVSSKPHQSDISTSSPPHSFSIHLCSFYPLQISFITVPIL